MIFERARRFSLLLRFFVASAGRATARRALPFYLGVVIASIVLFAGNGMDASTLTSEATRRPAFRFLLLGSWVLGTFPAVRTWLVWPQTAVVRALPVSLRSILAVLGLGAAVLQLPWLVLWLRGSGAIGGAWALATAVALQAFLIAAPRRRDAGLAAAVLAVAWIGPSAVGALLAFAAAGAAIARAWRRAAEEAAGNRDWMPRRGPLAVWTAALALQLVRVHAAVIHRVALLSVGAVWMVVIGLSNGAADGAFGITRLCLLGLVPVGALGFTALAGPLAQSEHELSWLLRATGAPRLVALAPYLLLASLGLAVGSGYAFFVTAGAGLEWKRALLLVPSCALTGAAWGSLGRWVTRYGARASGNPGARLVLATLAAGLFSGLVILRFEAWSAPLFAGCALGLSLWRLPLVAGDVTC